MDTIKEDARISRSLPSEMFVEQAMPQVLRLPDLLSLFVITVFFVSNTAIAASGGATSYIYWLVGGVTFFLPCSIAVAQLGVLFPGEGSLYNWTHRILGPYWAFFAGTCYWFPAIIIMISSADTIVTYIQGLNSGWLVEPWQQGLAVVAIIVLSGVLACQRSGMVKNLINAAAILISVATLLIVFSAVLWLVSGHKHVTSLSNPSDWSVNPQNFGLFSLVALALLGVNVPLNMGGEIVGNRTRQGQKAISGHILWGTLLVFVGYVAVTFALLAVQGPTNGASPFALVSTVDMMLGKGIGDVVVTFIMCSFLIATLFFNASFSRLLLLGAVDRRLPASIGRLNAKRVPANAVIFQTAIAVSIAIIGFIALPYSFLKVNSPVTLATDFYNVGLAFVSIVWALITLFFYVELLILCTRQSWVLRERRIFPWWVLWLSIGIGPLGCFATIAGALLYSWIPQQIPNGVWFGIIFVLLLVTTTVVSIGSMYATSLVAYERLLDEEAIATQEQRIDR